MRTPTVKPEVGKSIPVGSTIPQSTVLERQHPVAGEKRDFSTARKTVPDSLNTPNQALRAIAEKESFMELTTLNQILRLFHELLISPQVTGNSVPVNDFPGTDEVRLSPMHSSIS